MEAEGSDIGSKEAVKTINPNQTKTTCLPSKVAFSRSDYVYNGEWQRSERIMRVYSFSGKKNGEYRPAGLPRQIA